MISFPGCPSIRKLPCYYHKRVPFRLCLFVRHCLVLSAGSSKSCLILLDNLSCMAYLCSLLPKGSSLAHLIQLSNRVKSFCFYVKKGWNTEWNQLGNDIPNPNSSSESTTINGDSATRIVLMLPNLAIQVKIQYSATVKIDSREQAFKTILALCSQ